MSKKNIPWGSFNSAGKESYYLKEAFESGWVSTGIYVEKLESEINSIYEGSLSFAVSNGTAALQLAFQVLGIKPGDEVIVPGFCFQAAGNVLSQLGGIPVFCDVDSLTWNQTVNTIKPLITEKTVGIVIVHNYGLAAPSDEIVAWAKEKKLWVIEDCAEAWFTKYKNRYVGQFGDIATFSMHATKTISSGEGGIVMLNNTSLVEKLKLLRSHGLDKSNPHYMHVLAGNNYRLSNLLCAVAFGQLECRLEIESRQRMRMNAYFEFLDGHWALSLQRSINDSNNNIWAVAVKVNTRLLTASRDKLMDTLKERGVETRPGFYPASALPHNSKQLNTRIPVSEAIAREIIVLPCSSDLDRVGIEYICNSFKSTIESFKIPSLQYSFIDSKSIAGQIKLNQFLANLGTSSKSFRYFKKRDINIVYQHEVSIILEIENNPIGYGHIESKSDEYWLAIAIVESRVGEGWGGLVLSNLILSAAQKEIRILNLKVDYDNQKAIKFYQAHGFVIKDEKSNNKEVYMVRHLQI